MYNRIWRYCYNYTEVLCTVLSHFMPVDLPATERVHAACGGRVGQRLGEPRGGTEVEGGWRQLPSQTQHPTTVQ